MRPLTFDLLPGLSHKIHDSLRANGFFSLHDIAAATPDDLRCVKGIKTTAESIHAHACAYVTGEPVWLAPMPPRTSEPDPAPASTEEPALEAGIDKTVWDAILSLQRPGQPDILTRVLTTYLDDSRLLVEHIRAAVQAHDPVALAQAAHRLKSSSAQLGVLATAAHCKALETLGRLARIDEAAHLLAQLTEAHQAASAIITTELQYRAAA